MIFHHIGVAVRDIETSVKNLEKLSATNISGEVYDGGQKAMLCMCNCGGINIELIQGEAVEDILDKKSDFKIYHVCFEVKSIIKMLDTARRAGYVQITEIKSAALFESRLVVFVMNADGFMIEFLEAHAKEKVRI